jgi:radical SAM/Cys-rich protein
MTPGVGLPLARAANDDSFESALSARGKWPLARSIVTTLQVNVGKRCNQACHHCHVDAGPNRTETMRRETIEQVLRVLDASPAVQVVDITGGAPELNPSFRFLVEETRRRGRQVIDRCNLTVLLQPGMEDLPRFLAQSGVHVIASLPCYGTDNVDKQRGKGVFDKSIEALLLLNDLGYGRSGSALELDLVYNPVGAFLPPEQARLETKYKSELSERFGLTFNRLFTITNMPISRFAHMLEREGKYGEYMALLVNHFNASTVDGLMCRSLVSVGWDGSLFDCDFNQMLEIALGAPDDRRERTIWDVADLRVLRGRTVAVANHCFGCTAGAGSSCSGALQ